MNWKMKLRSLRFKLPLTQGLIVILISLVLFTFSYVLVDRYVVRQKLGDLMNLADAKYVHLLDMLDQGKKISNERAGNHALVEAFSNYDKDPNPDTLATLQGVTKEYRDEGSLDREHSFGREPLVRERFHEVIVADKNGRVIASPVHKDIGQDISKTDLWRVGRKKTAVISPFRLKDGHVVFAFVSPIHAETGHQGPFLGVLITEVDTGLLTMMMNADLGNILGGRLFFAGFQYRSLDIYVMNRDGQYLTQSQKTKKDTVLKKKGSKLPLERGLDVGASSDRVTNVGITTGGREAMDIYKNRNGVDVAGASMHLFDEGWTIVVEQDTKDAFASVINLERALVVGGILGAMLAAFLSWGISRRISESLEELERAAVDMAAGEPAPALTKRIGEYQEISSLIGSFNIMGTNLDKSIFAIRESNAKLKEIDKASRRMIDDLLEYVRPTELAITKVSVNEIVDEALSIVKIPVYIELRKEYEISNPMIEADRMKIVMAIVNILSREVSAMSAGGTLTVTTAFDLHDNDHIKIIFSDSSVDNSTEELPRLFEPTFSTMTSEMALGLPIVKRYILQHGGRVTAAIMDVGPGLVITVKLPVKQARKAA